MSFGFTPEPSGAMIVAAVFIELLVMMPFVIAVYILQGLGYMRICKKVGVDKGWMAFVPVANLYLMGQIAEKSDRVAYPEKEPRKWSRLLLGLSIGTLAASAVMSAFMVVIAVIVALPGNENVGWMMLVGMIAFYVVVVALGIALSVVEYMAIYRIYRIMAGKSAVWMLLLSIFVSVAGTVLIVMLGFSSRYPVKPVDEPINEPTPQTV